MFWDENMFFNRFRTNSYFHNFLYYLNNEYVISFNLYLIIIDYLSNLDKTYIKALSELAKLIYIHDYG